MMVGGVFNRSGQDLGNVVRASVLRRDQDPQSRNPGSRIGGDPPGGGGALLIKDYLSLQGFGGPLS